MTETVGIHGYRYATIPEWILDAEISPYSVRLFSVLSRYVGSNEAAWPSRRLLAERMHCSVDRVDASIKELVEIGAISTVRRHREDGSYTSNFYYLWPLTSEGVAAKTPLGSRQNDPTLAANLLQHERTLIERTLKKDTSSEKKKRNSYDDDFESLWKLYPRKVNKSGSAKAYCTARKRGATHEELMTATKNYALERTGQEERFTLHAQTFFGPNDRWRDYLPSTSTYAYELSGEEKKACALYDDYDGGKTNINPAKNGYSRPINSRGQLIDAQGRPFELDTASGRRRYLVEV